MIDGHLPGWSSTSPTRLEVPDSTEASASPSGSSGFSAVSSPTDADSSTLAGPSHRSLSTPLLITSWLLLTPATAPPTLPDTPLLGLVYLAPAKKSGARY